jgi:hypothetical protein
MVANYAIKSIVIIDFIDITGIAPATPSDRHWQNPLNLALAAV